MMITKGMGFYAPASFPVPQNPIQAAATYPTKGLMGLGYITEGLGELGWYTAASFPIPQNPIEPWTNPSYRGPMRPMGVGKCGGCSGGLSGMGCGGGCQGNPNSPCEQATGRLQAGQGQGVNGLSGMGDLTTDLSTLDFEGFASDFSNWVETSTVMGIPVVILGVVGLVGYLLLTRGHGKRAVSAVGSGAKKVYRTARAA